MKSEQLQTLKPSSFLQYAISHVSGHIQDIVECIIKRLSQLGLTSVVLRCLYTKNETLGYGNAILSLAIFMHLLSLDKKQKPYLQALNNSAINKNVTIFNRWRFQMNSYDVIHMKMYNFCEKHKLEGPGENMNEIVQILIILIKIYLNSFIH